LVSAGAGAEEEPDPLTLLAAEVDLGAGVLPRVGKGSGAPSRPCRCIVSQSHECEKGVKWNGGESVPFEAQQLRKPL
jgi:hypothetical protein